MAWTGTQGSGIFRQFLADALAATANFTPHLASGGTWQAALFGNTGTPDNTVAAASSAYNTGQWLTTSEVTDTGWPAKGRPLAWGTATRWTSATTLITFDADDTAGSTNVTLAGVYGDLVFDDAMTQPVADQGLAFHYFGGVQGVTAGTFTIVWHANGVARVTAAVA
jgi:hypothetical protein